MSKIDEIIGVLATRSLTDLLVAGYLTAEGGVKRFHPRLMDVFLDFNGTLIRCSSVDQYGALAMSLVDEVPFDFEIMDGDTHCVAPVSELCLKMPNSEQNIRSLRVLVDRDSRPDDGIFRCAGLSVGANDYLFLDPMNLFGIQLGKREDELVWERDTPEPEEGWEELSWLRNQGDNALRSSRA
jgi:hypothetical protein